jgi:hypothetical protein
MKTIKIYLAAVTILLLGAIGLGVYVWYTLQKFNEEIDETVPAEPADVADTLSSKEPITISTDSLSPSQKKMLESFGYTNQEFTITPQMIACAEDAVGQKRLAEITEGGAPSPIEALKLVPCFKR